MGGILVKDAQLEEPRLESLIREVEKGNMRLADIDLPELVGPILEQLHGILANSPAVPTTKIGAPPSHPPRPPPPPMPPLPTLHLGGKLTKQHFDAIGRLKEEIASQEEASQLRLL